ncbi:MAG: hypothetical protein IIZ89_04745, partial [Muribaculaceae bacterium]|nr:hypothetical protein [Muribaculaceae bacterium]
ARIGVAVPCPQVSSLYEELTWGLIHLRLFEPLAPSALAVRALPRAPRPWVCKSRAQGGRRWRRLDVVPLAPQ